MVLTGSSARDLREATADLADRRGGVADSDRLLLPMGGAELDDAWQLYLQIGGLPRAVRDFLETGAVSAGFVRGIVDLVRGDALRHTEMSEAEITAFLERIATGLARPMNLTKVANDVGLRDGEAVETRISALAMSFLVWRCFQVGGGLPNPRAQRKVYFTDPLLARLSHLFDRNRRDPDFSLLAEQQVGIALLRAGAGSTPEGLIEASGVMYERGDSGAEVDFVGPDLEVPVECKYVDDRWKRAAQPMRARHGHGVMVTRSVLELEDQRENEHPIHAIPAGIFAHLIDAS